MGCRNDGNGNQKGQLKGLTKSNGYGMEHGSREMWVGARPGMGSAEIHSPLETLLRNAGSTSLGSEPGAPILRSPHSEEPLPARTEVILT